VHEELVVLNPNETPSIGEDAPQRRLDRTQMNSFVSSCLCGSSVRTGADQRLRFARSPSPLPKRKTARALGPGRIISVGQPRG